MNEHIEQAEAELGQLSPRNRWVITVVASIKNGNEMKTCSEWEEEAGSSNKAVYDTLDAIEAAGLADVEENYPVRFRPDV